VTIGLWWVTRYYSVRLRPGYLRNRELFDELVLLFSESVRGMQRSRGSPPNRTKSSGSSERMRKSRHNSEKYF